MKEFKYKWKIRGEEYVGTRDCIDEAYLRNHIHGVSGELIEILESKEKAEIKEVHPQPSSKETVTKSVVSGQPQFDSNSKKSTPSVGIKIFGWLYIAVTILIYSIFAYLRLVKGVTPTIKFAGKIITSSQTQVFSDIFIIVAAMMPAINGIGLLYLKKWARIMTLVLAWLDIGNSIYLVFVGHINLPLWAIFTIWFFSRDTITYQFKQP